MKANYITVKDVETWAKVKALGCFEKNLHEGELWEFNQRLYFLSYLALPIKELLSLVEYEGKITDCACDIDEKIFAIIFRVNAKEMEKVEKCYQKYKESGLFSIEDFLVDYFGGDALGSDYYCATYKCTSKSVAERFFNLVKSMTHYSNYFKAGISAELQGTLVIIERYEH